MPIFVRRFQCAIAFLCLALAAMCAATSAHARDELTMGLITADNSETIRATWDPILEDMSEFIGMPVKASLSGDYAGIIWLLAADKVQLAWMGNKAALEASERTNVDILVKTLNEKSGGGYHSHLIARKDSGLDSEQDVLNNANRLIFGNGDPNSTSGFAVPGYYLFAKRGIDPNAAFKRIKSGNHEENFLAVADGKVDAATGNSTALGRYKAKYPERYERIQVIWTSPLIPTDPILIRSDVSDALKRTVKEFFIQYGKPAPGKSDEQVASELKRLGVRKLVGFAPSDNSQLDPIRKLELFKERLRIEGDDAMPADDKLQRLQTIDAKLKKLES